MSPLVEINQVGSRELPDLELSLFQELRTPFYKRLAALVQ
jgi:hypothetical protein